MFLRWRYLLGGTQHVFPVVVLGRVDDELAQVVFRTDARRELGFTQVAEVTRQS